MFGLAPSLIVFVKAHTQEYYIALFTGHHQGFCCPLSLLMMQVASMPLGLVSTQTPMISCTTHSSKLPFIRKAMAVVAIVRNDGKGICTGQN